MSIRKVGRIYWCSFYPHPGAKRVRQSLHTSDKAEAQKAEARLKLEHEEKAKHRAEGITLAEAYRHALRSRADWRDAKRPDSIAQVYYKVEERFGAESALASLDTDTVMDYGEELFDSGLAGSTINKRFNIISVLYEEAIKKDLAHGRHSKLTRPHMPYYKVSGPRKRLISAQEEARVLAILRASSSPFERALADLVVLLADTGMRLSEALNLKPVHINLEHRGLLVTKTKNDEDRVIPLTTRALEVLAARTECDPVFSPLTKSTASHIWRRVRAKMGLADEPEFVLHAFRHTYGSTLANAGTDAFRIQKVMGHKSIATTQGYVKVAMSALEGLSDIMENRTKGMHYESVQKSAQTYPEGDDIAGTPLDALLDKSKG